MRYLELFVSSTGETGADYSSTSILGESFHTFPSYVLSRASRTDDVSSHQSGTYLCTNSYPILSWDGMWKMSSLPGIQVAVTKTLGGGLIVAAELSESARDDLEINTSSWPFFISQKLWVYRRFRKLILKRSTKPSKRYQYWAHIRAIFRLEMFVSELIPNINVANWPMVELRSHRRHGPSLSHLLLLSLWLHLRAPQILPKFVWLA